MNIKRDVFKKYKKSAWLIEIDKDKYIHIPKPKTVLINIFEVCKWILFIPIIIILGICHGIYEGMQQIIFDFNYVKYNFKNIFPNIINIIEHWDNVVEPKIKDEYKETYK